jgi:two-component system chemotaxis sensor kinase CheA
MSDYLDPANEELLKDFFLEANAQIEILEKNILVIENDPRNKDSIDEIFRAAHTLKGNSGAVEMFEISEFTHILEDLLDDIRSEKIIIDSNVVDLLLESLDVVKEMIESRMQGDVYGSDCSKIKETLKSMISGTEKPDKKSKKQKSSITAQSKIEDETDKETKKLTEYEMLELFNEAGESEKIYNVEVSYNEDNPMNTIGGIQVFAKLKDLSRVLLTKPDFDMLYEDNYYPVVDFFISTNRDPDEINKKITIPDVTTDIKITEIVKNDKLPIIKSAPKAKNLQTVIQEGSSASAAGKKGSGQIPDQQSEVAAKYEAEAKAETAEKAEIETEKDEKSKLQKFKKPTSTDSTVLKVDSRRIDNLLNLVSETVINKATFNQISSQFLSILDEMHTKQQKMTETINGIYDGVEKYLKDGINIKTIKKELSLEYDTAKTAVINIESNLKNAITKLVNTSQNFGRITNELHEGVLQIRMVPISQIFSRFPRLVRDVSKKLDKKIQLVIEGEDTELDKSVIEQLLDPLIHCVRNSMDHGIEMPETRKENKKNEEGTIVLKAKNEGNMILIEISDDGKGIDVDVIREKAVSRGILHPGKALTEIEAFNLIFEPGFSTAAEVTNISGRGVGLDVVKKQIEKLNGSVNVWSQKGVGTTMSIRLPLTLAIIQGLLIKVGKEIYAIPITSVIESQRISTDDIKFLDNHEVFDVREDVVSLVRLNRLFGIPTSEIGDTHYIVVVGSSDKKIGLMVDQLIGEEDVVIKPLKDKYTNVPGIAGATILGDGQVSLILDVNQILELCFRKERTAREKRNYIK